MQLGAHETMEVHECLLEKVNVITHFNIYAKEAKNQQLKDMIVRHQQEEITSYNEIVNITRGNNGFTPVPSNTNVKGVSNQQIRYGLNNPPQISPQSDTSLTDREIAIAMLLCHKNAARNCTQATLEAADPNLRLALFNSAATCTNQAYEVFLFMNEKGLYQVPTLKSQTAETFLNTYQPAEEQVMAQYGMQSGQNMGYDNQNNAGQNMGYDNQNNAGQNMGYNNQNNAGQNMGYYNQNNAGQNMGYNNQNNAGQNMGYSNQNNAGQNMGYNGQNNSQMGGNMNAGWNNSVQYGSGTNSGGASSPYQGSNYQGMMWQ
jgi:spore coat protein CotF